jgi:hypothetical protein
LAFSDEVELQVQRMEQKLDKVVDTGTDEELFIASYLHGHFSLAISQALLAKQSRLQDLDVAMQESLAVAFSNQELELKDQHKVSALWQQLLHDQSK